MKDRISSSDAEKAFRDSKEYQNSFSGATDKVAEAFRELGSAIGKEAKADFKRLMDLEILKEQKKHHELIREAKKNALMILALIGCLIVYETWVRPPLEKKVMDNLSRNKNK